MTDAVEQLDDLVAEQAAPAASTPARVYAAPSRHLRMLIYLLLFYVIADRAAMWFLLRTPSYCETGRSLRAQEYLKTHPLARQMLIIGDSRVKWTVNPAVLAPAVGLDPGAGVNVAVPSWRWGDDIALLRWLEREGLLEDVKVIVWGLGLDRFHSQQYAPANSYVFFDPQARGMNFGGLTDLFTRYAAPLVISQGSLQTATREDLRDRAFAQFRTYDLERDYADRGYSPSARPPNPDHTWGDHFAEQQVTPAAEASILAAVNDLRARGIRVIVLDTPISPKLREYYQTHRAEAWATYQHLLTRIQPGGAEVYRAEEFPVGVEEFSDALHLTEPAADRYLHEITVRAGRKIAPPTR